MLLSHNRLCDLVSKRVITNVSHDMINSTSIDITLGGKILSESPHPQGKIRRLNLFERNAMETVEMDISSSGYVLMPGEFILAQSEQLFNLPLNISAEYKLKSSMARIGLEHMNAGWCDAGWNNSVLTLEFKNMTRYHSIKLQRGDRIGQVVFFEHESVCENHSYAARGRYNNDSKVQGIKP